MLADCHKMFCVVVQAETLLLRQKCIRCQKLGFSVMTNTHWRKINDQQAFSTQSWSDEVPPGITCQCVQVKSDQIPSGIGRGEPLRLALSEASLDGPGVMASTSKFKIWMWTWSYCRVLCHTNHWTHVQRQFLKKGLHLLHLPLSSPRESDPSSKCMQSPKVCPDKCKNILIMCFSSVKCFYMVLLNKVR